MRTTIFGIALLAFLLAALPGHAASLNTPGLNATLLYYEPVPATPGSLITVYIQIANTGSEASQVQVKLVDNGPFTVDSEAERVKTTPSIPASGNFLVKYQVRVSKDALPGVNNIKLEYGTQGNANVATTLVPLTISSSTVSLSVSEVRMDPKVFVPGNSGKLTIMVRNNADQKISSGKVALDLRDVDLTPMGSTSQQWFTDLQAGETRAFIFELAPSPNIASGVYKIPVGMNFTDQQGKQYSAVEFVGVRVGAEPDITVSVDDSKITSDMKTGDVIIKVTNKGLGEVKFVDITLGQSASYDLASGSVERYVGNIDSDDYKTARVTLTAKEDTVTIPLTVTYMDALNTKYTKEVSLTVPVRKAEGGSRTGMYVVIGLIVIGVVAYLVLRRRK